MLVPSGIFPTSSCRQASIRKMARFFFVCLCEELRGWVERGKLKAEN